MPTEDTTTTDPPANGTQAEDETTPPAEDAPDVEGLQNALKAERKRWEKAERELAELRRSQMSESEKAVAEAKAAGRQEAMAEVSGRLLAAEVRAAAAGKLADPADAVRLLDFDALDLVNDDGTVKPKEVESAIDDLIKAKPYLAPSSAAPSPTRPPQGARDGGQGGDQKPDDFLRSVVKRARAGG